MPDFRRAVHSGSSNCGCPLQESGSSERWFCRAPEPQSGADPKSPIGGAPCGDGGRTGLLGPSAGLCRGGIAPLSKACSCSPVESRKSKSENRDDLCSRALVSPMAALKGPGADGFDGCGADGLGGGAGGFKNPRPDTAAAAAAAAPLPELLATVLAQWFLAILAAQGVLPFAANKVRDRALSAPSGPARDVRPWNPP